MTNSLDRRLRRLEGDIAVKLPWGSPSREWTDEQLMAVIGEPGPLSEERLAELAKEVLVIGGNAGAIMLGVPEAATVAEWIAEYAPASPSAAVDYTGRIPRGRLDS